MLRILTTATVLALAGTSLTFAQAATNTAPVAALPTPPNLLADIYIATAIIDYCKIPVDPAVLGEMSTHAKNLQIQLNVDDATAKADYDKLSGIVTSSAPSCDEGSTSLKTVGAVMARYQPQPAAAATQPVPATKK